MNELLKVNYEANRITLSARELHEFLEIKTEFAKWMHRMCEYGFSKDVDYRVIVKNDENPLGGRPSTDYEITIDMAKEISMIQRNEKGKQARQYFIEVEKQWNSPERVIARGLIESKKMIENLNKQIVEMRPKALFADAVSTSKESILIGQLAKLIKQNGYEIGQNRLFQWLRENGYLIKGGSRYNQPTQKAMDLGLFEVKERTVTNPDGSIRITLTTKVTGKGQIYFVNKFCKS
ncbi:phage antirepressor KilAC domain-containing protein [Thomasclavelia spiroformis]|uniref:phage antirepressor KilAC domain-containing protein n=1 Tax=Thomasclavelia spiroformis TaxID=29348 RepID=UPI00242FE89A|nr:phage antirepressor KilAC domain-containing protein [Thomasclavelia spiroformis]